MRELAGVAGMPRVPELVCPMGSGAGSPSLRVSFLRLDEALAGNLVLGEKVPEIDKLFGEAQLVENDVSRELKILFQRFAHQSVLFEDRVAVTVMTTRPRGDGSYERESADLPRVSSSDNRRLWSISQDGAQFETSVGYSIEMPTVVDALLNKRKWPDKFKQFYSCPNGADRDAAAEKPVEFGAITCTINWRYVTELNDLNKIERDTDKMIRKNSDQPNNATDWGDSFKHKKHFGLFRYLGQKTWPSDFLVIKTTFNDTGCALEIEVKYIMPPFGLDIAMIENFSGAPVRIRDFIGVMERDGGLRVAAAPQLLKSPAAALNMGDLTIAPHGRAIVPLQAFAIGGVVDADGWGPMDDAKRVYQQITAQSARVFDVKVSSERRTSYQIKKDKSSFGPPELPRATEYLIGSRLYLSGFVVESQTVEVAQGEPRTITLFGPKQITSDPTAELSEDVSSPANIKLNIHETVSEGISCPILYSWDPRHSEWVSHGKVIDTANAPEKETTSLVDVPTDVRQVRLSEEEPEVSFVRAVRLILTLGDGRRVAIDPVGMPKGQLAPWLRIPAYHRADVRFDVPAEYESIGIQRAQIAVTGYYERYGSLLLSRLVRPPDQPN